MSHNNTFATLSESLLWGGVVFYLSSFAYIVSYKNILADWR